MRKLTLEVLIQSGVILFAATFLPASALAQDEAYTQCLHSPMKQLTLTDCSTLLDRLGSIYYRYRHGEETLVPTVLIHTRSGKDFRGFVLETGTHEQKRMVMMQLVDEGERFPEPKAAYIDVGDVTALSLLNANLTAAALASLNDGPYDDPTLPPTKLEIKRKQTRFSAILSESLGSPVSYDVDWTGLAGSPEELRNLSRLMSATTGELVSLTEQKFNRKQIGAKLNCVQFVSAPQTSVRFKDGTLIVSATLKGSYNVPRANLTQLLQQAL